jgi:hypothetical protein
MDKSGQYLTGTFYVPKIVSCIFKLIKERIQMGPAIEYQKLMTEIVHINLPGPQEPGAGMSGGELLHGFLAELYRAPSPEIKLFISSISDKWNVRFRNTNSK